MSQDIIEQTLQLITDKISNLNYCFIGSINLYIRGLPVEPKDIDILTDKESIYEIEKRLKEYQTKPIYFDESDGRNSYRTFFKVNGMEVEVLGNVNNACRLIESIDKKDKIKFGDLTIYSMPLEEEIKVYQKMGREDKVNLIKEFFK